MRATGAVDWYSFLRTSFAYVDLGSFLRLRRQTLSEKGLYRYFLPVLIWRMLGLLRKIRKKKTAGM